MAVLVDFLFLGFKYFGLQKGTRLELQLQIRLLHLLVWLEITCSLTRRLGKKERKVERIEKEAIYFYKITIAQIF